MVTIDNFTDILHPMVVHFPIALILTASFLAIIYIIRYKNPFVNRTIKLITLLAALGAWVAVISGGFTPDYTGAINQVENIHHYFAITTSILITISAIIYLLFSQKESRPHLWLGWFAFVSLLLSAIAVGFTGYFGGYIVYNMLLPPPL